MALTLGNGPFARNDAAGESNATIEAPPHILWFHDVPQRVRATFGGRTVVDTEGAHLLHETRLLPVYYLPRADVDSALLEPTDHTTHCPFKGDARYWTVRAGEAVAENAAWGYDEPVATSPDLTAYLALAFGAMDHWYDEDAEVIGHPRDPFHRIDVRPAHRRVTVTVDDTVVAETTEPKLLFESGLARRAYLPAEAWDHDRLVASDHTTTCAYKGVATYESVRSDQGEVADVVWRYDDPLADGREVAGMRCAPGEAERVTVDIGPPLD